MNKPSWRSEDGQLLRSLREAAGIDELVFARRNTVSVTQLRELETGGSSSFYNPAIKRSTGVKLLKKLGHELPLPDPVLLADPPEPAPAYTTPTKHDAGLAANLTYAQDPSITLPSVTARRGIFLQPVFWLLCLLSSVALVAFNPWAAQEKPHALLATAAPADAAPPSLMSSTPPTQAEVLVTTPQAGLSKLEAQSSASAKSSSCDWQYRDNSKTHTPNQPLKPGNYVYLEAQADTELCVLDSQNKKTILQLKAGMAKSVYGSDPFLVHSQDWTTFKLFFQGRRVHEKLTDVHHLLLNSQAF
jgi:transcriptional regulator with XRE-family HTH domain